MLHPQYHHPTQPQIPNPNPNLQHPYPQQQQQQYEPPLHPSGVNPYANTAPYNPTFAGFQRQTTHYEHPNVGSQTWVLHEVQPVRYETLVQARSEQPAVYASSSHMYGTEWTSQPLANRFTMGQPDQPKLAQAIQCEICNINCNSKDAYEKHIAGKKHMKNLQTKYAPTAVPATSLTSQMGGLGSVAGSSELEKKTKKLVNGGTAVESVRVCTICNVVCNSEEVFNKHLAGKKHSVQAGLMSLHGVGPLFAAIRSSFESSFQKPKNQPKKHKVVQSAWCQVCKINCNSQDMYIKHLAGKKHLKNLEKLNGSSNSNATASTSVDQAVATITMIGPVEEPGAKKHNSTEPQPSQKRSADSQNPTEDLETKKRKVVESGTAATAVRTCTVCNVVCNSQTVFNAHLAGQKHAAMVKKLTGAASTATVH